MATTISAGTNPYKLGSPPDFGTLYSGRALEFDGVVDYFTFPAFASVPTTLTVSFWVYPDSWTTDTGGWIMDSNSLDVVIGAENATKMYFNRESSAHDRFTPPPTGQWTHVVATWTATNVDALVYYNGASQTDASDDNYATIGSNDNIGHRDNATNKFDGKLTNVQIWDKVWSLSDVQYAYTHPEKLITDNSAVTSGTTISNLKAWYPCTEGNPRSPQTTVYDGSPKELGSDLVTNGGFDTDYVGWAGDSRQILLGMQMKVAY